MTRNSIFKNKSKLILILLLVAVLCFSLFAVACKEEDKPTTTLPNYNYTEVDDGEISNSSFNIGTSSTSLNSFPINATNWSLSKDSDEAIINSYAKSGVVKTTDKAWDELMNTFYKDSTLLSYALYANGNITEEDIKEEIKKTGVNNPTAQQIKEYTIENYFTKTYPNPSKVDTNDDIVYMLNNYRTKQNFGLGTSRKITSSTEITLEKGTIGVFTVNVNTINVKDGGANIRVINTFNGVSQGEYAVKNINTDGKWAEYKIYVQADKQFDCTVKLALGLGYGLSGVTEGTAFFDMVNFETIDALPSDTFTDDNTSLFNFNKTDSITVDNLKVSLYKISLSDFIAFKGITFFNPITDLSKDKVTYTTTDLGSCQDKFGTETNMGTPSTITLSANESPYGSEVNAMQITGIKNASITLTYDTFASVNCEEYAIISFYVKNNLSKLGSTNISFNVYDMLDGKKDIISRNVASVNEVSDKYQLVTLVVKNNFVDDEDSNTTNDVARKYKIEVIVGPSALSSAQYKDDFASGTVIITTPQVAQGKIFANKDDAKKDSKETIFDLYSMFANKANSTVSLYAGLTADYSEDNTTESYSFSVAPSDIGSILTNPALVKGYQGIVDNHIYVKEGDNLATETNTRASFEGDNGSYAGLINSKYNYSSILSDLESSLNFTPSEKENAIQPLMIYNKTADNYGFIGASNTVATSSYAKVSVTLRVVDNAKANIYLVNTSEQAKTVLSFADFSYNGTDYKADDMKLQLEVSADMMEQNGWLTVNFYIATGANNKNFRVEVWNGSRDGGDGSQGYVFVKSIDVVSTGAFTESARKEDTFTVTGNPLYEEQITNGQAFTSLLSYKRPLTDLEIKFNKEQDSSATMISYKENYIWAKNNTFIYAVYNTVEPVEKDPYANADNGDDSSSGCVAETDPSTFWLSFSSILLIVALVVALVMLIIKNVIRKRKANASDAKSHYTITSRTKKDKKSSKSESDKEVIEDVPTEEPVEEVETESEKNVDEQVSTETESEENPSYIYGDVEIFGENEKPSDDNPSAE